MAVQYYLAAANDSNKRLCSLIAKSGLRTPGVKLLLSIHADSDDQEEFERQRAMMVAPGGREEVALTEFNNVYYPRNWTGVSRHDYNTVPVTQVGEDDAVYVYCKLPTHAWAFYGIFDGHNGAHTSGFLADNIVYAMIGSLADLYSSYVPPTDTESPIPHASVRPLPPLPLINDAIRDTFLRLDSEIVNEATALALASDSKDAAKNYLAPACSGSSALVSFYESDSRLLRVALTGHSHAVLGRRTLRSTDGRQMYEVHALTSDRDAGNSHDVREHQASYTGKAESGMLAIRHMLGGAITRIFGDGAYKWDMDIKQKLQEIGLCEPAALSTETTPHLTAEPKIITMKVQSGDFLIMASHSLWDCLTDEEAVGLVGLWLEKNNVSDTPGMYWDDELEMYIESGYRPPEDLTDRIVGREQLPVKLGPDTTVMYNRWRAKKRFINIDSNIAVHLSRNALGGADRDLTAALLNMNHPRAEQFRDDITIHVVFFD